VNPELEKLKQAHQSDVAIRKANKQIQDLHGALQASKREHATALAEIQRLELETKEVWREEKRTEESTRSYQSQKANAIRALEQGLGSADAAERQIHQCEGILDELETTTLELMEQQERLAAELLQARTHAEAAEGIVADLKATTPEAVRELNESVSKDTATRDAALTELDIPTRDRYNALVKRKVTAMAPIRREACSACRRVVPAQQVVDLKLSRLQACRGCGRWLTLEDEPN